MTRSRLLTFIVCLLVTAFGFAAYAEIVNRVAAVVDDQIITVYEVEQAAAPVIAAYKNSGEGSALPEDQQKKNISQIKRQILQEMIEQKLVEAEVGRLGIPVEDYRIDEYVDKIKQANHLNDEQLAKSLAAEGKTMAEFREQIKNQILREEYVRFRLKNAVEVTEEDARAYYKQNVEDFSAERVISLSEIRLPISPDATEEEVMTIRQMAGEIYEELQGGADFAAMAKKHSQGPTASSGGSLGSWKVQTELSPSYRAHAENLKPGDLSAPYRDDKGYALLRCDAWEKSGYLEFDEVKDKILMQLRREKAEQEMKKLAKELYKKSFVDIKVEEF